MIELSVHGDRITAVDVHKNEVHVDGRALRETAQGPGIARETHADLHVRTGSIVLPPGLGHVESGNADEWTELEPTESARLDRDALVQIDSSITVYVRCTSPGTASRTADGRVTVTFPRRSAVTVGFKSRARRPDEVITVPRSTTDLAGAISCLATNIDTESPDRSFPSLRGHPPRIETGETFAVPAGFDAGEGDSGVTITVPDSLDYLFPVAPFAYYLGARVVVADTADPVIEPGAEGDRQPLARTPGFEEEVSRYLRMVFYLDCLVRNAGPYRTALSELAVVDEIGLDISDLYDRSIADRLSAYLACPMRSVEPHVPDWHLTFYLEPRYGNVRMLTHVLDRLGTVRRPVSRRYSAGDSIVTALDGGVRGSTTSPAEKRVTPELSRSRLHAWAAAGVPTEAFKTSHRAFENRLDREPDSDSSISIALVANDPSMAREADRAHEIYREHYPGKAVEYHRHRDLNRREFRRLLGEDIDCLHFIGHCEPAGLQCSDGWLSMEDVGRTNVRTFFLNACASYAQGAELVDRGAIGGGVTVDDVLDGQATKVGTTFAHLVVNGYNLANAIRLGRSRSILRQSYIAVGDGTYQLPHCQHGIPLFADITPIDDDRFTVTMLVYPQDLPGSFATLFVDGHETTHLTGNEVKLTLKRDELRTYLRETNLATMYDGTYSWSTDLAAEL